MLLFPLTYTTGFSEIPPSVAIAIAEGNVDPISMEAFDHALSARCRQDPIRIQTSGRPPRVEAPVVSARESCFVAFSNQKARETDSTGKLFHKLRTYFYRFLNTVRSRCRLNFLSLASWTSNLQLWYLGPYIFKIFSNAVQLIADIN